MFLPICLNCRAGVLNVPDHPIIPFIEGDGTGVDIWKSSVRVIDAAVDKAYSGTRKIHWLEVLAGEKAFRETGEWLPEATLNAFREYFVGIKGPLTTPIGGGIRSLNVALRQVSFCWHAFLTSLARSSIFMSVFAQFDISLASPPQFYALKTSTWFLLTANSQNQC